MMHASSGYFTTDQKDTSTVRSPDSTHDSRLWLQMISQLAVFMLCFQSCSTAVPVTGCTSVSTNTGTGNPTTLPNKQSSQLALSDLQSIGEAGIFIPTNDDPIKEVALFNKLGGLLARTTTTNSYGNCKSVILKDPLKLFMATRAIGRIYLHLLTYSGGVYAMGTFRDSWADTTNVGGERLNKIISEVGSTLIWAQHSNREKVTRFDSSSTSVWYSRERTSGLTGVMASFYMEFIDGGSKIFSGCQQYLSLYNKADFSQVKGFNYIYANGGGFTSSIYAFVVDNLQNSRVFGAATKFPSSSGPVNQIIVYDMGTASSSTMPLVTIAGYGQNGNNILNFGPYQYVVTIQQNVADNVFLFVNKADITKTGTFALSNTAAKILPGCFQGFVVDLDRFYFGIANSASNKNFQSYYLTVDRCVTKNGAGVCTQCLTPYYLMPIPGKECLLQADFPPGYGVKDATTGAACMSTGCINCVTSYLTCVTCNNTNGWYLNGAVCQHATLTPKFPSGFGPDMTSKLVVACAVLNCVACSANKNTCTKCNQVAGWFLNGNVCQSDLVAPLFPSGFGPNTVSGLVVQCSMARCTSCPLTFAACAACDTVAGWFLDLSKAPPQCQHATSAPLIAPGFGKNLVAGTVVPCQVANCVDCKADYTGCQACNTGAGWYLNTSPLACQNAATFGAGRGPNTGNGQVAACSDSRCTKCSITIATCETCDRPNGWYLSLVANQCQSQLIAPQFVQGFGPDSVSGQVKACTVVGCLSCAANYAGCLVCNSLAHYTPHATLICQYNPPCTPGLSKHIATPPDTLCQDTNCDNCCDSYTVCEACKPGWYLDGAACLSPTTTPQIASRKGANLVTKLVVSCLDINCLSCKSDYSMCTGCDTAAGWYLNGNVCQSSTVAPMIADGFGAKLADGTVAACADVNCKLCKASTLVCTACQTSNGWFLNGNTCQHASNSPSFPPGFGPNAATGNVVACQVPNCQQCKASFTACTGCDSANSWFLNSNACQHPTSSPQIPDWYGGSSATGIVLGCSDAFCVKCKASHQTCTGCDTTNGWFLNGNTCQHASNSPSFPPGFGPNAATGNVVACSLAHCLECDAAFAVCTGCDSAAGWFMNNVANQCESKDAAPLFTLGYGPDTQSGFAVSCSVAHCSKCPDNYLICTNCDTAAGWYLNSDSGLCNHKTIDPLIPNAYGPDLATGNLEKCDTIFCDECLDDFTVCTNCMKTGGYVLVDATCACDTSKQLFQDPQTKECINSDTLVDTGKGGNFTSRQVSSCLDAHCVDCHQNSSTCNKCDFKHLYYLTQNNTCLFLDDFPSGLGANNQSYTALPCAKEGCVGCQFDYLVCSQCDIAKGYLLKNDSCKMKPADVRLTIARFSFPLLTAEIKFSALLSKDSKFAPPFNIRFFDVVTKKEYSCQDIGCALKSVEADGFTLVFNSSYQLIKGDLFIERSDNMIIKFDEDTVWINYPIKVPEFAFISRSGFSAAAGAAMTAMNSARMPLSIALSFAAPAAASFIDGLLNTLFLLKMLEGPGVSFPDSILAASMDTNLIPIDMGNPFQAWVDTGNSCRTSSQLLKQGVACNMLDNEGMNILQIAIVAITTVIVAYGSFYLLRYIVKRWLEKERKEKKVTQDIKESSNGIKSQNIKQAIIEEKEIKRVTRLSRLAQAVQRVGLVLGIQFIIIKMEGYQVEMTFMSVVGIKHSSRNSVDAFSTVIGLAFIAYYALIAALCFRKSLWIWDQVEALQYKHKGRVSFKNKLSFYIKLERSPNKFLNYLFDEVKVPDQYWKLLLPVVIYLRSTAMCLAVTLVLGKPWQQVTLVTMAESLMLAFEIASNIRHSKAEHWADMLMRSWTIIYLGLKNLTTSETFSEPARQEALGTMMAVVLLVLIVIGFGFAIYAIGVMLVQLVKGLIAKVKAMKEQKLTLRDEDKKPIYSMADSSPVQVKVDQNRSSLGPPMSPTPTKENLFRIKKKPIEAKERRPDSPFQIDKSSDPKADTLDSNPIKKSAVVAKSTAKKAKAGKVLNRMAMTGRTGSDKRRFVQKSPHPGENDHHLDKQDNSEALKTQLEISERTKHLEKHSTPAPDNFKGRFIAHIIPQVAADLKLDLAALLESPRYPRGQEKL